MSTKLASNVAVLLAAATLAVAIGGTYLVPCVLSPVPPKAMAAGYFALFGAGATLAMFVTRASTVVVIGSFAVAGAGLGLIRFGIIPEGLGASSSVGIFALAFSLDALGASIAGAVFGGKLRRSSVLAPRNA